MKPYIILVIACAVLFCIIAAILSRPAEHQPAPITKGPDYNEVPRQETPVEKWHRLHPAATVVTPALASVPSLQTSFTSMVESFIPSYNAADTEIRKTNVRFQRKDAIVQYFAGSDGLRFQGWVGEVQGLTTESDGKAYVSVKLKGSETVIQTWNNSFSDYSSNTMISRSNGLYQSLMDIRKGDEVTVSGTFILEGSGQDYVREASLTEEGSMTSPEFIVRFSQISKR